MSISLLLPTRGRPERLALFFQSLEDKSSQIDQIEVVLYFDDDDHDYDSYQTVVCDSPLNTEIIVGPRISMGEMLSALFRGSKHEIIGLVNDDIVIETENWDQLIEDHFELCLEDYLLFYPADGFHKKAFRRFLFSMQSSWVVSSLRFPTTKEVTSIRI